MPLLFFCKNTVMLLHSLNYGIYEQGIYTEKEQVDMRYYIANLVLKVSFKMYFSKPNRFIIIKTTLHRLQSFDNVTRSYYFFWY